MNTFEEVNYKTSIKKTYNKNQLLIIGMSMQKNITGGLTF